MDHDPTLTDEERTLLIDILEHERHELPAEIHHAMSGEAKAEYRDRLRRVEQILDKFRPPDER